MDKFYWPKTLDNKKTKGKKTKKVSKSIESTEIEIEANANSKDYLQKEINENDKVASLDKNDEIELIEDINNARKKRRRSSASIE